MSIVKANTYQDATGGSNATFSGVASPPNGMGFRNRVINGNMVIDQRNAGAAVVVSASNVGYAADRFRCDSPLDQSMTFQQQTSVVPANFSYALKVTAGTATSNANNQAGLVQFIEGYNVADLGFGTANAKTFTLSFQVYSSLTGTFGICFENDAGNRSFISSYTINSANTWETKTVTIPGDTSGTWLTTNGRGLTVFFDLGQGTARSGAASSSWANLSPLRGLTGGTKLCQTTGATWYITGVQLEAGTVASPFERRDYGRELMLCQRYYEVIPATYLQAGQALGGSNIVTGFYRVTKRATPTLSLTLLNGSGGGSFSNTTDNWSASAAVDANGRIGYSGTSAAEL